MAPVLRISLPLPLCSGFHRPWSQSRRFVSGVRPGTREMFPDFSTPTPIRQVFEMVVFARLRVRLGVICHGRSGFASTDCNSGWSAAAWNRTRESLGEYEQLNRGPIGPQLSERQSTLPSWGIPAGPPATRHFSPVSRFWKREPYFEIRVVGPEPDADSAIEGNAGNRVPGRFCWYRYITKLIPVPFTGFVDGT